MTTFPFNESDNYYVLGKAYANLYIAQLANPGDVLMPPSPMIPAFADARDHADGLDYPASDPFWDGWDCALSAARNAYWRMSSGV